MCKNHLLHLSFAHIIYIIYIFMHAYCLKWSTYHINRFTSYAIGIFFIKSYKFSDSLHSDTQTIHPCMLYLPMGM